MKNLLTATIAGVGALTLAGTAAAAPVTDGITAVEVTVDLDGVGIAPAPLGSAEVDGDADGLVLLFPITGGDLDPMTLGGTIEHDGSGLSLSANDTVVSLENFTINTVGQVITALVTIETTTMTDTGTTSSVEQIDGAPIFTFDLSGLTAEEITDTEEPSIVLLLSEFAATALADSLAIPALAGLAGTPFALAGTAPILDTAAPVPLPGAAALFVTGAAVFAARRRKAA